MFILETAFGLIKVTRIFRSIEPSVVQGIQTGVPNSRNTDRRVDFYIVQREFSMAGTFLIRVVCHGGFVDLVIWIRSLMV